MKLGKKRAFTLIELLVVITIIGILATGAVNVYTSQIQKARDSTRITDISALRTGLEQAYQDKGAYPNAGGSAAGSLPSFQTITTYVPKIPIDPKTTQKSTNSNFDYTYAVAADINSIVGQAFEVSTHFENSGNTTAKSLTDGGNDNNRLELGINVSSISTPINIVTTPASWAASGTPGVASCLAISGTAAANCPTSASTTTNGNGILVIK